LSRIIFVCLIFAAIITLQTEIYGAEQGEQQQPPADANAEIQEYIKKYGYTDKSSSTVAAQPIPMIQSDQPQPAGGAPKDLAGRVKLYVNKLGSTAQISDQTFGKNQLVKLGSKAVPHLNDYLLKDKRTYVRIQIARVLGIIKDELAIPSLEAAAASQYPALNKTCVEAIAGIGGRFSEESLSRIESSTKDEAILAAIKEAKEKQKKQIK